MSFSPIAPGLARCTLQGSEQQQQLDGGSKHAAQAGPNVAHTCNGVDGCTAKPGSTRNTASKGAEGQL